MSLFPQRSRERVDESVPRAPLSSQREGELDCLGGREEEESFFFSFLRTDGDDEEHVGRRNKKQMEAPPLPPPLSERLVRAYSSIKEHSVRSSVSSLNLKKEPGSPAFLFWDA